MRGAVAALGLCLLLTGCASAQAEQPREQRIVLEANEARFEPPIEAEAAPITPEEEKRPETAPETPEAEWVEPEAWEPEPTPWEPVYDTEPTAYEEPTDGGLTEEGGVNMHDGRTETWYSSNTLLHHRTDEWTVDDEGFYRDQEGRYVVAASDMEQGTVFEGSKGECVVLDTGCADGTTDYYTNWG